MVNEREIDALLAEHLFRLDVAEREVVIVRELGMNNSHVTAIYDAPGPWSPCPRTSVKRWVVPGGPGDYQEIDRYSTTGDGMLAMIEAMRARGYSYSVYAQRPPYGTTVFSSFENDVYDLERCGMRSPAETLPMSTALSALRGLGVEVPA